MYTSSLFTFSFSRPLFFLRCFRSSCLSLSPCYQVKDQDALGNQVSLADVHFFILSLDWYFFTFSFSRLSLLRCCSFYLAISHCSFSCSFSCSLLSCELFFMFFLQNLFFCFELGSSPFVVLLFVLFSSSLRFSSPLLMSPLLLFSLFFWLFFRVAVFKFMFIPKWWLSMIYLLFLDQLTLMKEVWQVIEILKSLLLPIRSVEEQNRRKDEVCSDRTWIRSRCVPGQLTKEKKKEKNPLSASYQWGSITGSFLTWSATIAISVLSPAIFLDSTFLFPFRIF